VQQAPDIVAMSQDEEDGLVLFTAFMKQTFPDYASQRLADAEFPAPQARPVGAPRFEIGGQPADIVETFGRDGEPQQTFMSNDGWFITRSVVPVCSGLICDYTALNYGPWR